MRAGGAEAGHWTERTATIGTVRLRQGGGVAAAEAPEEAGVGAGAGGEARGPDLDPEEGATAGDLGLARVPDPVPADVTAAAGPLKTKGTGSMWLTWM